MRKIYQTDKCGSGLTVIRMDRSFTVANSPTFDNRCTRKHITSLTPIMEAAFLYLSTNMNSGRITVLSVVYAHILEMQLLAE